MLADGKRLYAYPFSGYWKDVGTINSLWEANMDLLGQEPLFETFDPNWKIYSRNDPFPPQFIAAGAFVKNSLITVGCYIEGRVVNSLLSNNVKVGKGALVEDSVIFSNTVIEEGAQVRFSIIDEDVLIRKNGVVGIANDLSDKITVVSSSVTIGEGAHVLSGSIIEKDFEG